MRILLIGGGSGGHITPLLAVARELKQQKPDIELIGVCEKGAPFVGLFKDEKAVDRIFQVRAGKYRRYAGLKWYQRWFDIKTLLLNIRDIGRTLIGYVEARRLLKELRPDMMVIKGGFVGVPMGLAASRLNIPFITHDSDSTPGLANRIVGRWALRHATGMPTELYDYPKDMAVFTGIPVSDKYKKLNGSLKTTYRDKLGMGGSDFVITVVGGSQGGGQLNTDFITAAGQLMQQFPRLGIVHIAGPTKEKAVRTAYKQGFSAEQLSRIVIKGFTDELEICTGAADVVVTRAGANATAELALQGQAIIVVPGKLAGAHQDKNAAYLKQRKAVQMVAYGDAKGLQEALTDLLNTPVKRAELADNLNRLAKPQAAKELASLALGLAEV